MSQSQTRTASMDALHERMAAIDADLHGLVLERARVATGLIAARRASGETAPALDPLRDADLMRQLVERHEGAMPVSAIEHLWRDLIATCARLEAPYTVYLDGGADLLEMLDVARFHFGFAADLEAGADAADVVGAVAASRNDIGVIGLTDRSDLPWWRGLSESGAQISARLPFLVSDNRPADMPALVVTRAVEEKAPADIFVYDARWSTVLPGDLMGQGIEVVSFHRSASGVDALLAISSELDEAAVLKACDIAGAEPDVLRKVGGYAAPIDVEGDTDDDFDSIAIAEG